MCFCICVFVFDDPPNRLPSSCQCFCQNLMLYISFNLIDILGVECVFCIFVFVFNDPPTQAHSHLCQYPTRSIQTFLYSGCRFFLNFCFCMCVHFCTLYLCICIPRPPNQAPSHSCQYLTSSTHIIGPYPYSWLLGTISKEQQELFHVKQHEKSVGKRKPCCRLGEQSLIP